MSPRRERAMVPPAQFESYYGQPILKEPVWKTPDVPAYLFLGGMAGSAAGMATLAEFTGREQLGRVGHYAAAGGAIGSVVFLIHDLGRPLRFLNMLRVIKPTSPLSVGSWILAPFSGLASAAAASRLTGITPGLGRAAGFGAGVIGPALATYTAVLLADTAVPAWHDNHRELPFLFAGSALASGAATGLLGAPTTQAGPARRMALAGVALELAAAHRIEAKELVSEPYRIGKPGKLMKAARALNVAGAGLALFGRRSRVAACASGAALLAGSLATRFGVFEAGMDSARDPKYTVIPQRERLRNRTAHRQPEVDANATAARAGAQGSPR